MQPLAFIDTSNAETDETREEETGVKLSKDERPFLSDEEGSEIWEMIKDLGEDEDLENYELIDVDNTEDEPEDFNVEDYLNGLHLAATDDSSQDDKRYKVRYKYVKGTRKNQKVNHVLLCEHDEKWKNISQRRYWTNVGRGVNKNTATKAEIIRFLNGAGVSTVIIFLKDAYIKND